MDGAAAEQTQMKWSGTCRCFSAVRMSENIPLVRAAAPPFNEAVVYRGAKITRHARQVTFILGCAFLPPSALRRF